MDYATTCPEKAELEDSRQEAQRGAGYQLATA